MLQLLSEPAWKQFIRDHNVVSETGALEYLTSRIINQYGNGLGFWIVELTATEEPLGICGLIKRDYLDQVDIGFALLEKHWGKSYAVEAAQSTIEYAFNNLKLPRLLAITIPDNVRSIRLLNRLGFQLSAEKVDPDGQSISEFLLENQSSPTTFMG